MQLFKAISCAGAHLVPWGRKSALFEEAHATILRTAPRIIVGGKEPPSQICFEERVNAIVVKRREWLKRTLGEWGIVEVYEERDTHSDNLILEIDEHMEKERAGEEYRPEIERRLTAAGVELRNMALHRGRGRRSGIVTMDVDGDSFVRAASPSQPGTKSKSRKYSRIR